MIEPVPDLPAGIVIDSGNHKLVERVRACLVHPLADSFRESIDRLAAMAAGMGGKVRLGLDFADLSFRFALIRPDGSCWIVGGLLFHGQHDRGGDGGAPTFAVCVQPVEGWALHT